MVTKNTKLIVLTVTSIVITEIVTFIQIITTTKIKELITTIKVLIIIAMKKVRSNTGYSNFLPILMPTFF